MKLFRAYLLFALIGSVFFGCKKYPENKLWFKDPTTTFKGGKITSYTRNGLDRMPYFRSLYSDFPYNYYGSSINDVFDIPFEYDPGSETIKTVYGEGSLKFYGKKKDVQMNFKPINMEYGAENILIENINWKILKLTKDGVLKLHAKHNFVTYEIQFN